MTRSGAPDAFGSRSGSEGTLAWALAFPALAVIVVVGVVPILWTLWESLHVHDLRMPWLGRPFVGLDNYGEALADRRVLAAFAHTAVFVVVTVTLEIGGGLALALGLDRLSRSRGLVLTAVLMPWALPAVVAAMIWRFIFESPAGLVTSLVERVGLSAPTWFADALAAWVPLVLADVWKTTPFVTILLLAGLQNIDRALSEAAALDGAGPWRRFTDITLPLLRPALLVAVLFRTLDAFRVFDVVYVLTGGGPGTATESIALLTFNALLQNLRFGFGSALAVLVFAVAFTVALASIRWFGGEAFLGQKG